MFCDTCAHLQKKVRRFSYSDGERFQYGCTGNKLRGYTGWISNDSQLKTMGCGGYKAKENLPGQPIQMELFKNANKYYRKQY